jgi:hypothetical protein
MEIRKPPPDGTKYNTGAKPKRLGAQSTTILANGTPVQKSVIIHTLLFVNSPLQLLPDATVTIPMLEIGASTPDSVYIKLRNTISQCRLSGLEHIHTLSS